MTQNQLPTHLQQYQVPDLGSRLSENLGSAMPPHVNIGDGRFTLIDAAGNEIPVPTHDPKIGVYLDACIIDVADVKSRIYYEGSYDKKQEGKRPVCFSDNGIGPSTGSSIPQAPTCAACPRSEWTKINANGNKVPWCTEKYKVALLIPGFPTLFMLAVPPGSHGPLREYVEFCKGNGALMANLITRMWFISQGVLGFQPVSYIDETVAKLRQEAYAQKRTDALVGRNDTVIAPQRIALQHTTPPPALQYAVPNQQPNTQGQIPFAQAPVQGAGQGQQFVQPVQQSAPQGAFQPPNGQGWPGNQQVQQPGPFGHAPTQQQFAPNTQVAGAPLTAPSPSEGQPAGRRKRRTQAEIAATNGVIPGERPHGASSGQQAAPFPHPGQQPVSFTSAPTAGGPHTQMSGAANIAGSPGQQLEFGIGQGQDASASPEVQSVLNSFFGT